MVIILYDYFKYKKSVSFRYYLSYIFSHILYHPYKGAKGFYAYVEVKIIYYRRQAHYGDCV